jgi:hypothetical protein
MKRQKGEMTFPKDELMMSDLTDIPFFPYKPFKEEFKEEKSSVDQGMTFIYQSKYFRPEGCKKQENDSYCNSSSKKNYKNMTFDNVKNNDDDNDSGMIYISDLDNDNADNYEEDKKESEIEIKSDDENDNDNDNYTDTNFNFNLSSAVSLSISYDIPKNENNLNDILSDNSHNKKIFRIVKVGRFRDLPHPIKKRRGRGKYKAKKNDIDWENIQTPKEKHFHLDRKKKRIVFQRKHLKMIYSIANLPYPFNFTELYKLIDEHVGDKTVYNYGNKKSYHIIRINGQTIITTMKEKKNLLGRKVKPKNNK